MHDFKFEFKNILNKELLCMMTGALTCCTKCPPCTTLTNLCGTVRRKISKRKKQKLKTARAVQKFFKRQNRELTIKMARKYKKSSV